MTRVHDMGGRYGDGKINPDLGKEDVFKQNGMQEPWR